MTKEMWDFVDAMGTGMAGAYGFPAMTGRVLGWLLVCDPPEQTAAELAEALSASKGAISGATSSLVRARLVDRVRVRGKRPDRFRLHPGAWDAQIQDQSNAQADRHLIAQGLDALGDAPAERRARLEELDAFYASWQDRIPRLWDEWDAYRRTHLATQRRP